ncbi:MAG: hypothetical protein U0361_01550 [Nitrospiraceae bacterium]
MTGNTFDALSGRTSDAGFIGIFLQDVSLPSRIEQNRVLGFMFGIAVNDGLLSGLPFSLAAGSASAAITSSGLVLSWRAAR